MKRISYYILYLLCCLSLGAYGQSPDACNYIISHTYTKPDGLENRTNIDYYDGLGRLHPEKTSLPEKTMTPLDACAANGSPERQNTPMENSSPLPSS